MLTSDSVASSSATEFLYRTQHELGFLSLIASLFPAAMAFFMAGKTCDRGCAVCALPLMKST